MLIELINFNKKNMEEIEYTYFLNGEEKKSIISMYEDLDYTDYKTAFNVLTNFLNNKNIQTKIKEELKVFNEISKTELQRRYPIKLKPITTYDFHLTIDDVFDLDENSKKEEVETTLKNFSKAFYSNKMMGYFSKRDIRKIQEIVFYFFISSDKSFENIISLNYKEKKVKEFLKESSDVNMLKLFLNLERF